MLRAIYPVFRGVRKARVSRRELGPESLAVASASTIRLPLWSDRRRPPLASFTRSAREAPQSIAKRARPSRRALMPSTSKPVPAPGELAGQLNRPDAAPLVTFCDGAPDRHWAGRGGAGQGGAGFL